MSRREFLCTSAAGAVAASTASTAMIGAARAQQPTPVPRRPLLIKDGCVLSLDRAAPIIAVDAVEAATAPAALVQRNSRRDIADFGRQAGQQQEKPSPQPVACTCVIGILPKRVLMRSC
jgi:hypothetical protein